MIQKTLRVPTDWNDITIGQYQEFCKLPEEASEEQVQEKLLTLFCGLEAVEYKAMSNKDKDKVAAMVFDIFNREPQRSQFVQFNGKRYGFHPNLEEITFGEFVDMEQYQTDVNNLHKVAHVLFRPVTKSLGKRYQIEPYVGDLDACEQMLDFPVGAVLAAQLFFWKLGVHLSNAILKFSEVEGDKRMKNTLSRSGAGRPLYTTFARAILEGLMKSPKYLANEHFFGLLLKATRPNLNEQ